MAEPTLVSSLSSEELLDESDHLWLLDGTGVVLIEGGKDLIESLLRELVSRSEVSKSVLDELFGLILVEVAGLVFVICVPQLINDRFDGFFLSFCRCFFVYNAFFSLRRLILREFDNFCHFHGSKLQCVDDP